MLMLIALLISGVLCWLVIPELRVFSFFVYTGGLGFVVYAILCALYGVSKKYYPPKP